MKNILAFADVHLGIRTHSTQTNSGLYDAEIEARIALDAIYNRCTHNDIELIICAGDIFHSSHPTTRNIEFFIGWLEKLNKLGKKVYIIPGNHDVGTHSHSMVFLNELNLSNISLLDSTTDNFDESTEILFGKWIIKFVPYFPEQTGKDKTYNTHELVSNRINNTPENLILVTHIHESEAKIGSESIMLSKKVANIDFNNYKRDDIILLSGHIHQFQSYIKNNGIRVVYPGSIFYHDRHDVNTSKGYVLINENGDVSFEQITNIRKFSYYKIPEGKNAIDFLKSFRFGENKLIFLHITSSVRENEKEIRDYIENNNCKLGDLIYTTEEVDFSDEMELNFDKVDPFVAFSLFIDEITQKREYKNINRLKELANSCIQENIDLKKY